MSLACYVALVLIFIGPLVQVSEQLTGFGHNGVSTFGMKTPIPVRSLTPSKKC